MRHYEPGNPKPEFMIGLAGPVGTDLKGVASKLAAELRAYRYETDIIRVSDVLKDKCDPVVREYIDGLPEDARIDALMNVGDYLRCELRNGAAVIPSVINRVRMLRQNFLLSEDCHEEHDEIELYNRCYIINSLKHPAEIETFRNIYGRKFILLSVVAPMEARKNGLISKISQSYETTKDDVFESKANSLIEKDRQRLDTDIGQNISDTFPLADFFIRTGMFLCEDIGRFLRLLFGCQKETPTRLEYAMFEARANALRSADLSRQVGAVITTDQFEIVARGCNEVPVPGGDVFWSDDQGSVRDNRDISKGRDFNAVKKVEILREALSFLDDQKVISLGNKNLDESVDDLVFGTLRDQFKHLRISNLIEFGRMVHAEMSALMEAARRGLAVRNGKMVVTTFPCHMCARHIISSGIREVYFIEPYPKSLTSEIYRDEIEIESAAGAEVSEETRVDRVYFRSFHGVAPRYFNALFEARARKDQKGYALPFKEDRAVPPSIPLSRGHLAVELTVGQTADFVPRVSRIEDIRSEFA